MRELALLFLRLGLTAFGGPAAHIALMKQEVVDRRGWLTHEEFLDLLGATNLLPGPNSTEMAIHIGWLRSRWPGLLVAGLCFILPAALLVALLAQLYVSFGSLPRTQGLVYAVKPVLIVVVAQAILSLVRPALKTPALHLLGAVGLILAFLGVDELALLFGCGALAGGMRFLARPRPAISSLVRLLAVALALILLPTALTRLLVAGEGTQPYSSSLLFAYFLKVGSVLYGSGYVLLAFLQSTLVERWHWLSEAQLLDAVAVGQVTPGPVLTTATFVGYLLGRGEGAALATLGIFLPSFLLVALSGPLVRRVRQSVLAGAFLDGVNVASLALMIAVAVELARAAVVDPPTVALALVGGLLIIGLRVNSAWVILAAAGLGFAVS